ncbi:PIG-L family deacetylase [Rhodococcus sp. X156]|uniref:PIG-L family deacetylase n=1 Tax=Rhodococcus sp. X156 TaxID=2499145 RepID=UPI000FDC4EC8|nr:PIG-L family deacetylase [Rhodococcus sp. X156]
MSVLVCFHAHPDDEVFNTGGVMRLAADAGHRVVVVTATDGALGEFPEGLLAPGERLADRREKEVTESVRILGADRLVLLGYADSGMAGTEGNHDPEAFCNADVEQAATRLAAVLREEGADVLTVYDAHGGYGHPDHVQVHRVGVRAAELAGTAHVYEATTDRDHMRQLLAMAGEWSEEGAPPIDVETFGLPASEITTTVDVSAVMAAKRAAMHAYPSQVGDFGPFLDMPTEQLTAAFGREWFRKRDAAPDLTETALAL